MPEKVPVSKIIQESQAKSLAKLLYVITSQAHQGLDAVREYLSIHLEYLHDLENKGILFAAGPLFEEDGEYFTGDGMVIIRANSLEEAQAIAAADPLHANRVRQYQIRPWLLNEGSIGISVSYSQGKTKIN